MPLDNESSKMADEGQDLEQKRSQSLADYGRDAWVGSELRLKLKERVRHFTWTWFTMTMATGGIANVLSSGGSSLHTMLCNLVRLLPLCSPTTILYWEHTSCSFRLHKV